MKKLLKTILLLLFVGCSLLKPNSEIYVYEYKYLTIDMWICYDETSEAMCIASRDDLDSAYSLDYHGTDYENCTDYCNGKEYVEACHID